MRYRLDIGVDRGVLEWALDIELDGGVGGTRFDGFVGDGAW